MQVASDMRPIINQYVNFLGPFRCQLWSVSSCYPGSQNLIAKRLTLIQCHNFWNNIKNQYELCILYHHTETEYLNDTETDVRWGPSSDQSDLSKVFEQGDILGVLQATKGFDKSDFCEVISICLKSTLLLGFIDLIKSKGGNI